MTAARSNEPRKPKSKVCPYHGRCSNPGRVWLWGCVTHKHLVKVCRDHEQIYRDYGWIRVYRRREATQ